VKSLKIAYSNDYKDWTEVQSGNEFLTGVQPNAKSDDKKTIKLDSVVTARYLKIMPQTWDRHVSIRAGLLVQSDSEF
jgi:hypothetical protein